jgi:beta propeller repeat protein
VVTFPVCTATGDQEYPAVSGNTVVWEDFRSSDLADIYGCDLSTKTEFFMGKGIAGDDNSSGVGIDYGPPAIDGNTVVWTSGTSADPNIEGYDLSTKTEFPICTAPGIQEWPAVSGNVVVWQDFRNGYADIYGYDLSTKTEFQVPSSYASPPEISGDTAVWQGYTSLDGPCQLFAYDMSTATETIISSDVGFEGQPVFSGSTVLWWNAAYTEQLGYDLSTHTYFTLGGGIVIYALSGNIGLDGVAGRQGLYGYDLSTKTEFPICTLLTSDGASTACLAAISGATVVWCDWRNWSGYMPTNTDIYAASLEPPGTLVCTSTYPFAADKTSLWRKTNQKVTISAGGDGGGSGTVIHYSTNGGTTWGTQAGDSVPVTVSAEGSHHFECYASDSLGTGVTCDLGYVNIDKVKPTTRAWRVSVKTGGVAKLGFRIADALPSCGEARASIQVRNTLGKIVLRVGLGVRRTNVTQVRGLKIKLKRGVYTWRVLATDIAGNRATRIAAARLIVT